MACTEIGVSEVAHFGWDPAFVHLGFDENTHFHGTQVLACIGSPVHRFSLLHFLVKAEWDGIVSISTGVWRNGRKQTVLMT